MPKNCQGRETVPDITRTGMNLRFAYKAR